MSLLPAMQIHASVLSCIFSTTSPTYTLHLFSPVDSSIANSPTAVATIESPVIPYTTDTTRMPTQRSGQPYIPVSSPSMTLSQMHSADEAITTGVSSSKC